MSLYCTVDYAQSMMNAKDVADTDPERVRLFGLIRTVSRRIDNIFASPRPVFAPYIEARRIPIDGYHVNSYNNTLLLDGSLLALTSATAGGTALTNVSGYPDADMPPFPYLRLTQCAANGWYTSDCSDCGGLTFATITGVWGINHDYANAWLAVDAITTTNIDASVTTFTVADVDGFDLYGNTPRISQGNLIKIGDEYMEVIGANKATNVVTVRRGVNGSTAAAHVIGDTVYTWQVEDPIRHATARQVGLLYARRGAYTTVEITAMGGEIRYPTDLLNELRGTLQGYVYGN